MMIVEMSPGQGGQFDYHWNFMMIMMIIIVKNDVTIQ